MLNIQNVRYKVGIVAGIFIIHFSLYSMNLVDLYKEYPYSKKPIFHDYMIYNSLKTTPMQGDSTFVAVPWTDLLVQKKLAWLDNKSINTECKNRFTICIHYKEAISQIKRLGVFVIFTPHVLPEDNLGSIKLVPIPFFPLQGIDPAEKKDILVSFVGLISHPSRRAIFNIKPHKSIYLKKRVQFNYFIKDPIRQKRERIEYKNVLARSRYSLCPRGSNPGTIRFWESLQAGAIPILIDDPLILPDGVDWEGCIVRITKEELSNIYEILSAISHEEEEQKRQNCLDAYQLLCKQDIAYNIRKFFGEV